MLGCLWWLGQFGIILEIFAAAFLVYSAWQAKQNLKDKATTKDAQEAIEELLKEMRGQYFKEIWGFSFLAVGLVLQIVGNCR
ncbi:MAG: hypothetical protein MUP30_06005 [Deltaproteobacteria bacterium]|nr:hypothetical protein [Deltaproteobacteria bacterium]